jgi:hypothetical protein
LEQREWGFWDRSLEKGSDSAAAAGLAVAEWTAEEELADRDELEEEQEEGEERL